VKIEISSTGIESERKAISPAQPARCLASARRVHLSIEGYMALAAAVVVLLIVIATLPGRPW
jgi:hypothetical protein